MPQTDTRCPGNAVGLGEEVPALRAGQAHPRGNDGGPLLIDPRPPECCFSGLDGSPPRLTDHGRGVRAKGSEP